MCKWHLRLHLWSSAHELEPHVEADFPKEDLETKPQRPGTWPHLPPDILRKFRRQVSLLGTWKQMPRNSQLNQHSSQLVFLHYLPQSNTLPFTVMPPLRNTKCQLSKQIWSCSVLSVAVLFLSPCNLLFHFPLSNNTGRPNLQGFSVS